MKPTLAIISTYDTACGIAGYTAHIVELLKTEFDVTVIPIDIVTVMRSDSACRAHFVSIAKQGLQFDYVNIQFEYGIFGRTASVAAKNLELLLHIFNKPSVTIHGLAYPPQFQWGQLLKDILRLRLRHIFVRLLHHNKQMRALQPFNVIKKLQATKSLPIFVHTKPDARYLKDHWQIKNVFDHPLCYVTTEQRNKIVAKSSRKEFPRLNFLKEGTKLIGAFGFLNDYKGFDLAILALKKLPPNYHLAIFGGLHPNSHVPHCATPNYIDKLQRCALGDYGSPKRNPDVSHRVHFMGQLDDQSFLRAMAICDVVVVPYFEVGQSSSGPLSMAVDMRKKVIASRTKCFRAFGEYNSGLIRFFDIGNILELSQAIEEVMEVDYEAAEPKYTAETNREHYKSAIITAKSAKENKVAVRLSAMDSSESMTKLPNLATIIKGYKDGPENSHSDRDQRARRRLSR